MYSYKAISVYWEVHLSRYNELIDAIWGIQIRRLYQHILIFTFSTMTISSKTFLLASCKKIMLPQDPKNLINNNSIHSNVLWSQAPSVTYSPLREMLGWERRHYELFIIVKITHLWEKQLSQSTSRHTYQNVR